MVLLPEQLGPANIRRLGAGAFMLYLLARASRLPVQPQPDAIEMTAVRGVERWKPLQRV